MYRVVYEWVEETTEWQNQSIPIEWDEAVRFIKELGREYDLISVYIEKVDKP